ncbi:MAG TPA: hypothetical protein VJ983_01690 [candidate division Zixibacteria bacterium]|nr:hypothetical protein [candidate division Zixibacteria bacterium]
MTQKFSISIFVSVLILVALAGGGCKRATRTQRLTVKEFRDSFGSAFSKAGDDSSGFDAMEELAKTFDNRTIELVGSVYWDRPYEVKPEAKGKLPLDLTFGDLTFDSANITYFVDQMPLSFAEKKAPYIGPDLSAYGPDELVKELYPLNLPLEYLVLDGRDTVRNQTVVVRGSIAVDWTRGLRTKHEPMKSISLRDCEIVEVLPSTP